MNTEKAILLVEDNPYDEELTLIAFRQNRIANPIIVARDGEEALDYLFCREKYGNRSQDENPQLILLDLKLPKVDGLEVLRQIRTEERTRLIPVVVLTSSKEERDVVEAYNLGTNSYIRKPVDFLQFAEAIKYLGMYWLVFNESPIYLFAK